MKLYYFLIPIIILGCKTKTGTLKTSEGSVMESSANKTDCPMEGTCSTEIYTNSTLEIVGEGSGRLYTQKVAGENIVVEFTYFKPGPVGTADGNYTESIQFEVPSDVKNLNIKDGELSKVKLVFGKMGYRNATFLPVLTGKLLYEKTGNTIFFALDFELDGNSHEVSQIRETVIME